MNNVYGIIKQIASQFSERMAFGIILIVLISPFNIFSAEQNIPHPQRYSTPIPTPDEKDNKSDSIKRRPGFSRIHLPAVRPDVVPVDSITDSVTSTLPESIISEVDTAEITTDSISVKLTALPDSVKFSDEWIARETAFVPNPTRAVWLSALFPGLGQIYNRRYWKLPIVVGAYMGLGYATSWNNRMLSDYTRAYRDIMDTDPSTKSYMDFFPKTTKEEDLDKSWLTNTLKSRKNYFRQNRDLCIICMVGVYLLAMVDAYVDASLSQFDLSPDLSMQVSPTLIQDTRDPIPSVGVHWAFCF